MGDESTAATSDTVLTTATVSSTVASTSPAKMRAASSSTLGSFSGGGQKGGGPAQGDASGEDKPAADGDRVFDPIESKESWSKLLGKKRAAPLCEHEEPCISFQTKKPGVNTGEQASTPA